MISDQGGGSSSAGGATSSGSGSQNKRNKTQQSSNLSVNLPLLKKIKLSEEALWSLSESRTNPAQASAKKWSNKSASFGSLEQYDHKHNTWKFSENDKLTKGDYHLAKLAKSIHHAKSLENLKINAPKMVFQSEKKEREEVDEDALWAENKHLLQLHKMYVPQPVLGEELASKTTEEGPPTSPEQGPESPGGLQVTFEADEEGEKSSLVAHTPVGPISRDVAMKHLFAESAEMDVEAITEEQIMNIRTGDDAISFFARNSATTRLKIVYCNRIPPSPVEFRPYDLVVVPEKKADPEYFTISPTGIVHCQPGQASEYLSIPEWISESLNYNVIVSMNTFKNYVPWKIFGSWRKNARYDVYKQKRKQLAKRLFLVKPLFAQDLAKCFQARHELCSSVKVLALTDPKSYQQFSYFQLQEFIDLQKAIQTTAGKELEARHDHFVSLLDALIHKVVKATGVGQDETAGKDPFLDDAAAKTKSIVQLKLEAKERARRKKLAIHDQGMIQECIQLVDYIFQSCSVQIMIDAAKEFYMRIEGDPRQAANRLFSVNVKFAENLHLLEKDSDTGMQLEPDADAFGKMLNNLWQSAIAVLTSVPQFIMCRQYEQHLRTIDLRNMQGTQLSINEICRDNLAFSDFTMSVLTKITSELERAGTYADETFLKMYRPVYEFGLQWDEIVFLQHHTQDNVGELDVAMAKMRAFEEAVEKCRVSHNVGFILIDAKGLKNELTPIPEKALQCMKQLLKTIGSTLCGEASKAFEGVNKILDQRPDKLSNYAQFVHNFTEILTNKEFLIKQRDQVEQIYSMLTKVYKVNISLEDQVQLESMQLKGNDFVQTKLQEAKQFMTDTSNNMLDENKQKCVQVEEQCQVMQEELLKENFIDVENVYDPQKTLEVLTALEQIEEKLDFCEKSAATFTNYEDLFKLPEEEKGAVDLGLGDEMEEEGDVKFEFVMMERARELFNSQMKLWEMVSQWNDLTRKWSHSDFTTLDAEVMNKQTAQCFKVAYGLEKTFGPKNPKVVKAARESIERWRGNMGSIMDLGNPAMRPRHWEKLFKAMGMGGNVKGMSITLALLEKNGIFAPNLKELIGEVSATASGEFALEQSLDKVIAVWSDWNMPIQNHRNQKDLFILGDVSEIIVQIEDHCVTIATMMGSRYIGGIKEKVEIWMKKIYNAADILDEWIIMQRAWMYLENIFSAEDIQKQLPGETTKFKQVDRFYRELFRKVKSKQYQNAMTAMNMPGLKDQLTWANETLDAVQKSLEAYLETKRQGFPRFYFLSNDELLSILSQTRNPRAVQEHLVKCFDSINHVKFTEANTITGMQDHVGEHVAFAKIVETTKPVEHWLCDIEMQMIEGLYVDAAAAVGTYPEDGRARREWLFGPTASQNILFIDQIHWTSETEAAIVAMEQMDAASLNFKPMENNIQFHNEQLANSVLLVRENLTKLQRTLMGALIVLDVHGITVLENLLEDKCHALNDFNWSKQLRYYWYTGETPLVTSIGNEVSEDCILRQTISSYKYSYEYLGNTPRLVVTPLTDKCYITLTGALHLNYGGAPAGPAGTGKTETTKDLGKALAVPVIVFNCSDGLDYKIMGRFFSGLAQAGAWACFDEFNRIPVEVLSVIAQQMLTVTQAIRQRRKTFEFIGQKIPLNTRFGVFITMNPGYAGRAELPDNLKSLFRPVAMMVPDYALIAEIILYSEGFGEAKGLSKKMVKMYSLASEQLSKQDHYDFGMRAVKSVLVMAGQLKRKFPDLPENVTLIRALRDSNVPKFLAQDLPLFMGIITDLFPGVDIPNVDYGNLELEVKQQLVDARLQTVPAFVTKIIQLLETQLVRHGVMIVGLTMCGKSTNQVTLSKSLTSLKKKGGETADPTYQLTKVFTLNPKSVTMNELYGSFNLNTGEWTDGLIAILVREAVSDTTDNKKWVNFDGPVDAIWIENMNTVLDDNKMLCLANGERIKLPPTMTMMFEVNDLAVASPATVSRCGMVYMEPVHLGWKPLIHEWQLNFSDYNPKWAKLLAPAIEKFCSHLIPFYREELNEPTGLETLDNQIVHSFLKFVTTFVSAKHGIFSAEEDGLSDKPPEQTQKHVKLYCVFACIFTLGGNLHEKSRKKFQQHMRPEFEKFLGPGVLPDESVDMYALCVDDENVAYQPIGEIVSEYLYDSEVPFFNILVPTEETTSQRLLLENLMHAGFHILFAGDTGVGKSVGIQQFLNTCGESYSVTTANFSAQTSSANVVDIFENSLEKKRKNLLGAPPGTTMLMFIDDLNMPLVEVYGAQPPIELLRQVMDQGGFYDRKKLFWKNVQDTQFITACGPPGGGRNKVTPRLMRHVNMVWMPALTVNAMNTILSSILGGWLGTVKPSLRKYSAPLTKATVEAYFRITADLLPTPLKCHYTFNLRDPAKMIQGMMMIDVKKGFENPMDLINLWMHEACRCFRDRLINEQDCSWFNKMIFTKLKQSVGADFPEALPKDLDVDDIAELVYGDFMDRVDKKYIAVPDNAKMLEVFGEFLEEYNITFPTQMNLVFFSDCQKHLARMCRVLRQPRGNALLVGVSGVGRKSMARLAAFMQEIAPFSIEITKLYDLPQFNEDIKLMMFQVAKGTPTMFLFSDTQIVRETFLENINNILNTGEVPNLFAPDELNQVVDSVRPLAKAAGKPDQKDVLLQYFTQLVRESLHIVNAFSPVGDGFRARCRQFPSLINCCAIDWYKPWPADALYSVAERYYKAAPKELNIADTVDQLSQLSCTIHSTSTEYADKFYEALRRRTYTTPTSYLELIKLFCDLLGQKQGELNSKLDRYRIGVRKLGETQVIVDDLKKQLTKMGPEIEQAKIDTAALMEQVEKDQKIASEQAAECAVEEKKALGQAAEANEIKNSVQKDLDEALPEYYKAIKALDSLDKKDITEVKSFAKPPPLVETVLCAVCLLMGEKENWDSAKKLMNKSTFLDDLKTYDKDALARDKKKTEKMQKYTKREDFQPDVVKKVSNAAMSLCMWVRAMEVYGRVSREIEPKKVKLAAAEEAAAIGEAALAKAKGELKVVTDKVAALRQKLFAAKRKAEQLVKDADMCQVKLGRAEELLKGLGNEAVAWEKRSTVLEKAVGFLVGNIMLAAGFIAYIGPYTAEYRAELIDMWRNKAKEIDIVADPDWVCADVLVDPAEVRAWNLAGLPQDDLSVENGIMVTRGRRWPLMIDPQGQANRWIRTMGKDKNIQVIKLSNPNFLRTLENGIRYGNAILLENVEEVLDPSIEPVLLKQIFKKGGQLLLRLGTEDVPYNEDFAFYITTKMTNPHYLPEICIKVTVINFTVTPKGLENQLVADVVANENRELSEQKAALVVQIAADKAEMDRLEALILKLLAESKGDILDDDKLIKTLAASSVTGAEVQQRMVAAEETLTKIDEVTETLRPTATRLSMLYFCISYMGLIDPMYQYSLEYFAALAKGRLQKSEQSEDVNKRIMIIIEDVTKSVYLNICRGLFEDHKMIFSFMIACEVLKNATHANYMGRTPIATMEWAFLLRGVEAGKGVLDSAPAASAEGDEGEAVATSPGVPAEIPAEKCPKWLPSTAWEKLACLERLAQVGGVDSYKGLCDSISTKSTEWNNFYEDDDCISKPLPDNFDSRLKPVQRLLVCRSLRENLWPLGVKRFIGEEIGGLFIESPPFDLLGSFEESNAGTPIIFVLSAGADPTGYLLKLAEDREYSERLHFISLGQGQGPKAEKLIDMSREAGDWACLQNCHLASSWMPNLERIQELQDLDKIDPDYRLWLTSMPTPIFPVPVLQSGIKITNEPPKGVKANMLRTFEDMGEENYGKADRAMEEDPTAFENGTKVRAYKRLVFALAFFHAVILQRRKFGPIGWNIPYEWMDSDFQTSREQVYMYLATQPGVPLKTLNYMIAECNYGGRVTDDKDVRLICAVLLRYFDNPIVEEDEARLSALDEYFIPMASTLEDVKTYIKTLPLDEDPRVFGLHPNAMITAQMMATRLFLSTVESVQPRLASGGGGKKPEDIVTDMAREFFEAIPEPMKAKWAHENTYKQTAEGGMVSLGVFHGQEMGQFNKLSSMIKQNMYMLGQAIKGLIVMSGPLEDMYNCFLIQKVPPGWGKLSYPCLKPLNSYMDDLLKRLAFYEGWLRNGPPASFWISSMFFPQGFMTAAMQTYARSQQIAIDELKFLTLPGTELAAEVTEPKEIGVNVHGLFLQGCGFDRKHKDGPRLVESSKGILFVEVPVIWLKPVKVGVWDAHHKGLPMPEYNSPLYKTSERRGTLSTTGHSTNFVMYMQFSYAEQDPAHWTRRGVALICMLDD
ncbi:unnamed protein product [Amoebophrya sp. A120]|nr:unnamed protein product [Amoebophrya sp. A120]|eukprot:GSA120T00010332001.1